VEYLAYIVLVFTAVQLLVALVNVVFTQPLVSSGTQDQLVSVLIPARNEEENIANLLNDLRLQAYQNIEVLVFDDESTDKTTEIVKRFSGNDSSIRLLKSRGLKDGWLGKNFACHNLAEQARGSYFLFLDADVRISNDIINKVLHRVEKEKLGLLSIFPRQIMATSGEWITVPLMNYILLTLLPLVLVHRSKFPSLAAANGQFMFFEAQSYRHFKPHLLMKDKKVEDIEIIRFLKQRKVQVTCLSANDDISCRMYPNFSEAVNGFTKNIIMFFSNSFLLAIVFWLITTLGFIPVLLDMPTGVFIIYLAAILLIRIIVSLASRQSAIHNILYLIPQQLSMMIILLKTFQNHFKKEYRWKDRNIS
jgi:glycosyltransferase involved in cell wall biosynthesis